MHDERSVPREQGKRLYKLLLPLVRGVQLQPGTGTHEYTVAKPFFGTRGFHGPVSADDLTIYEPAAAKGIPDSLQTIHLSATMAADLLGQGLIRQIGCSSLRVRSPGRRHRE